MDYQFADRIASALEKLVTETTELKQVFLTSIRDGAVEFQGYLNPGSNEEGGTTE